MQLRTFYNHFHQKYKKNVVFLELMFLSELGAANNYKRM